MPAATARKKIAIGFSAAAVLPALILLDTLIGFARGWRMIYRQEQAIVAGVTLWLAAAVILVCIPRGRAFYLKGWTRLVVLLFFLVAALLCVELVIRWLPGGGGPFHLRPPNHQWIFRPDPRVMPGITGDARYTTNADGVRGPEMPRDSQTPCVLCLGGSTTECLYLDDEETWTRLLAADLARRAGRPVWTGGAGSSGLASDADLAFVQTSTLMRRVNVVVLLVGINDLAKALVSPGPARSGDVPRPELVGRPIWRRSATLIRGGVLARNLVKRLRGDNLDVEDAAGASYISRRERRRAAVVAPSGPDFDAAIAAYRTRIEAIVDACAAKGVKVVLVTQPVLWDARLDEKEKGLLWFGWLEDGRYLSVTALRAAMDRYNDALRGVAKQRGVALADLAPMNGRAEFFVDDCHFNEAGARRVAAIVAPAAAAALAGAEPRGD
jgi:lysophospholipase L1-like esterase